MAIISKGCSLTSEQSLMHLVVIGGAGFVGRHFVAAALQHGHRVTVVGRRETEPEDLVCHVYRSGGLEGLAADLDLLARADLICHFATATTPAASNREPLADLDGNLRQTVQLLESMRRSGNRRILYLSSGGAVYGAPQHLPIDERHPLNPISSYGVVKVAIENYLRMYEANQDFRATIIRPSNPYGPGQDLSGQIGAVTTFLRAAFKEEPITIWGDGTVVRDYIFISDLVSLLLLAVESQFSGVFNCGSGVGTSLIDLIDAVERASGRQLSTQFEPARAFDPSQVILDVSSASRTFGWRPAMTLAQGIDLTIAKMLK